MPDDSPAWAGFFASVLDHCGGTKLFTFIGADFSCQTNTRLASFALTGRTMRTAFRKAVCLSVASAIALSGCATPEPPASPAPIYVDPARYSDLDCDELNAEAQRLLAKYAEIGGELENYQMAGQALLPLLAISYIFPPLMLLWVPFIPALKEAGKERQLREEEYKHLMGERDAILKAAAEKGCPGVALQQAGKAAAESSPPKADDQSPTIPDTSK